MTTVKGEGRKKTKITNLEVQLEEAPKMTTMEEELLHEDKKILKIDHMM